MTLRVGIAGISGRMGVLLARAAKQDAILAGGTSRSGTAPEGAVLFPDIGALGKASDVVVDFTHADAVAGHAEALMQGRTAWVLGTTGYDEAAGAAIARAAAHVPVVVAANFSTGVNLMLILAEMLGGALPAARFDAEIVEMHHRQKLDAPSGTALALGRAVAAGRKVALGDVMTGANGAPIGARRDGEIGFASLRGGQVVGHHDVMFTAADEQIVLSHHAFDRMVFANGALRAALWLAGRPPGLYGMRDILGL
ncbi:MAG: 4-hydroxy-tetrahydrodipicolinate reductase [Acidocella sp.]|nr:4-hydroxy-tetrahydrodipicolinate reductase [Acidocella sp.]